ncbi:MAG: response regulator transcription factor [Trueperaceae bacterium]|jgi:DNA-binding response OmpR family regulator|nr:response regulator transcription factor [Truepera sp.]HRN19291.1 response regulator transcription factor [Trueperaceae bacterium]HRQ11289.1 response regulator transcription factor [Trueperaceae bacterium]
MSRILVVEDDRDAAQVVSAYLTREGYEVTVVHDGAAGLQLALQTPPALIVLDWMLPGLGGPEFITALRREQRTPIIMLTARSEESDRIVGLELGADDYVVKPFSPRELVARVRAVLRRSRASESEAGDAVEHRGLRVDPLQRQATFGGRAVDLTTLEFDLLYALVRAPGRVFSRNDLIDRVWGPDFAGVDRVVDVHISNLRQKLASVGADTLLVTVRGVGYKVG